MSVTKNKETGKWECQFYIRRDGKLKKTRKRGFDTKQEAQAYELAHRHDSQPSGGDSFGALFESLALHNRASEVTTAQRRTRIHKYCADLVDRPIRSITKEDFLRWRESLNEWDIATQTKNDIIGYVKQVGRFAWEMYDIPDNSKVLKTFPKQLDDYHEMVLINSRQFAKFISFEENPIMAAFFRFLFMTGCRKGEAKALLKSDYDPVRKRVHIYKSMRRGQDSLKTTKTRNERWVTLDNITNEKIAALCQRDGKWMFGDISPLDNSIIAQHFKENLKKAELPDMRIHDLRHSHVSMLWDAGVPVPSISKRIGHSSPKVTMECYSHIFDKEEEKTMKFLNELE